MKHREVLNHASPAAPPGWQMIHGRSCLCCRSMGKHRVRKTITEVPLGGVKIALIVYPRHSAFSLLSRLTAKLTKRRRSENTSRFFSPGRSFFPLASFSTGDESAENMLSPPPDDTWATKLGNDTRLPPGLEVALTMLPAEGSISSDDKKDAFSSSGLVLVIVRNESSNPPCSAFGVPLRSRIYEELEINPALQYSKYIAYLLEVIVCIVPD